MATIVIGMGNPVLSDDSVGLRIAQQIALRLPAGCGVAVRELNAGGLRLMEAMAGYDRAIIVDSMMTPGAKPGTIHAPTLAGLFPTRNTCSTHDGNLATALELGKMAGLHLPSEVQIWAVEAANVTAFSEQITPAVGRAVPRVVKRVMRALQQERRARLNA